MLVLLAEVGGLEEYRVIDAVKNGIIRKPIVAWLLEHALKYSQPRCSSAMPVPRKQRRSLMHYVMRALAFKPGSVDSRCSYLL